MVSVVVAMDEPKGIGKLQLVVRDVGNEDSSLRIERDLRTCHH